MCTGDTSGVVGAAGVQHPNPASQGEVSFDTETYGTPCLAEGKYADATAFLAVDHEEKNNGYATFCGQSVRSCQ